MAFGAGNVSSWQFLIVGASTKLTQVETKSYENEDNCEIRLFFWGRESGRQW